MIEMDFKNISDPYEELGSGNMSDGLGGGRPVPGATQNVRILVIDHNTTSLMSLASMLKRHFYKVSTAESTGLALSLLQANKNDYNIVIADLGLPESDIYMFIDKCQHMNIPLIFMVEDQTVDTAMKALEYGWCYLFYKPLSQSNILTLWQYIYKVAREIPTSLVDAEFIDKERRGNPSSASTQNQRNSRKSGMTWTYSLHKKFLQAINILGEKRAEPETLLRMMNEPSLRLHHVYDHLKEYRDHRKGHAVDLQKTVAPQIPGASTWLKPPNSVRFFAGYTLHDVRNRFEGLVGGGALSGIAPLDEVNDPCEGLGGGGALPRVAPNVRILLIDHNTTSLMSHASQFEQHLYKVSAVESTKVALSLLRIQKNYYNIVIADLGLKELEIYVLVDKCRQMNIPLILMAGEPKVDIARKALEYGPCYLVDKPLSQFTIATFWMHIYRVTGEMPTSLTEEKHGNPSSPGSGDGGSSSQRQRNSKRKLVKTEIESTKRTKNHLAEDSSSPSWLKPPNFAGYTLDYVTRMLDAWNNERAHGNGGVMLPSNHLRNRFKAPGQELKGATRGVILAGGHPSKNLNQK